MPTATTRLYERLTAPPPEAAPKEPRSSGRGYWENPQNVAMHYQAILANPGADFSQYGWDAEVVTQMYDALTKVFGTDDYTKWGSLSPDNALSQLLREIPEPPPAEQYQSSQFQGVFGNQLQELLQSTYGPYGTSNQQPVPPTVPTPPMAEYQNMPAWQKAFVGFMANGTFQSAANMLPASIGSSLLGMAPGVAAGSAGAATAGAATGFLTPVVLGALIGAAPDSLTAMKNQGIWSPAIIGFMEGALNFGNKIMEWAQIPGQVLEQGIGTYGVVVSTAMQDVVKAGIELAWGNEAGFAEAALQANRDLYRLITEMPEIWEASKVTVESLAPTWYGQVNNIIPGLEYLADIATSGKSDVRFQHIGEVFLPGQAEPVKVDLVGLAAIQAARAEMAAGVPKSEVTDKYKDMFGLSGQMLDTFTQTLADPLNLAAIGEIKLLKLGGKIASTGRFASLFNDLGIHGPTLQLASEVAGNQGLGFVGASKAYGQLLQGVEVETMARGVKRVAGVTPEGIKKELLPPPTGAKRYWGGFLRLTPKAQGMEMINLAAGNVDALMLGGTPDDWFQGIKAWSDLKPGEAAAVSNELLGTPMGYTTNMAMKDYWSKVGSKMQTVWNLGADHRAAIDDITKALGEKWAVVFDALRKGDEAQLQTFIDRMATNGTLPEGVTIDTLKNMSAFVDENYWAAHPEALKAQIKNTVEDFVTDWSINTYKIQADPGALKLAAAAKNIQNIAFLNLNPGYWLRNVLNNDVTRLIDGTLGFQNPERVMDALANKFGILPFRLAESGHGMADIVSAARAAGENELADAVARGDMVAANRLMARKVEQKLGDAARSKDLAQKAKDMTGKLSSTLNIFGKASSASETAHSAQSLYVGAMRARNQIWKPKMDTRLAASLDAITPGLARRVEELARSAWKPGDIDAISTGTRTPDASWYLDGLAQTFGQDSALVREALEGLGIADDINAALAEGRALDDAFNGVEQRVQDYLSKRFEEDVEVQAQAVAAKINKEGFVAGLKVFEELQVKLEEHWTRHFDEWERFFTEAEGLDYATRSALYEQRQHIAEQEWKRLKATNTRIVKAITQEWGVDAGIAGPYHHAVEKLQTLWDGFFADQRKLRKQYEQYLRDSKIEPWRPEARAEYDLMLEKIAAMYEDYGSRELLYTKEIGSAMVEMFDRQYGVGKSAGVQEWWGAVHDIHVNRQSIMRTFREWERGVDIWHSDTADPRVVKFLTDYYEERGYPPPPPGSAMEVLRPSTDVRRAAWPTFIEEVYLPVIRDYVAAGHDFAVQAWRDMNGIQDQAIGAGTVPPRFDVDAIQGNANKARAIASQYGIETIDETGKPLIGQDIHILRIIKKYGGPDGLIARNLDDVNPDTVKLAFDRRAEAKGQPTIFDQARIEDQQAIDRIMGKIEGLTPMLGADETAALRALIEGHARYNGMSAGRYVTNFLDDVVFGGTPGDHALFTLDNSDVNWYDTFKQYIVEYQERHPELQTQDVEDIYFRTLGEMQKLATNGALRGNSKTLFSLDVTGECPYTAAGRPCIYCYNTVPQATDSPRQTTKFDQRPYGGEIKQMPQIMIDFLNEKLGGLRVFSMGDLRKKDLKMLHQAVQDAQARNLKIKMITKQPETLNQFMRYDNVGVNLSCDFHPEYFDRGMAPLMTERLTAIYKKEIRQKIEAGELPKMSKEAIDEMVAKEVATDVFLAKNVIGDLSNRTLVGYGWQLDHDPNRPEMISAMDVKTKHKSDFVYEDGTSYNASNKFFPQDNRVTIRYVAMNPEEAILSVLDPRIDLVTMFHGTIKDPNKWMDVVYRQNPYLSGIGEARTNELLGQLDDILHSSGLLPEGMQSRELFTYALRPAHERPPEIAAILDQKIGSTAYSQIEAATAMIRKAAAEAEFDELMAGPVFDRMRAFSEKFEMERPSGPGAGQQVLDYLGARRIKYSEDKTKAVQRAKEIRDKGSTIVMRKQVDFSQADTGYIQLGPTESVENIIKHLDSYTFHPVLGPRTARAIVSIFDEAKPGEFWAKGAVEMITPQMVEKVMGRPPTLEEFEKILEIGFEKNCCVTSKCPTCNVRCALEGNDIHISRKAAQYELPIVLNQLLRGERIASIEWGVNQRAIIRAFKDSTNVLDMVHEVGHLFRRTLNADDMKIAADWAGAKKFDGDPMGAHHWNAAAEEKFAKGFEKYVATQEAPTPQLAKVFEKFKQWLVDLYHSYFKYRNVKLTPEIKGVYDRMLGMGIQEPRAMGDMPLGALDDLGIGPALDPQVFADGWQNKVRPYLDEWRRMMREDQPVTNNGLKLDSLPAPDKAALAKWLKQQKGELARANLMSVKVGEMWRDFSLLNYNRRYGYDNWVGAASPYIFWPTRSMQNWSLRMIDKPGLMALYARLANFTNDENEDLQALIPTRMKGKFRLSGFTPGLPEWAGGGLWIDPYSWLLPFRDFVRPYEKIIQTEAASKRKAYDILDTWAETGEYSAEEIAKAQKTKSGPLWDKAFIMAKAEEQGDPVDFMQMFISPAAYLSMPYYALTGQAQKIGPTPLSKAIQGLAGGLGIPGLAKLDLEAVARKQMGLNTFGEWGDYYIKRQMANMAVGGAYEPDDIVAAITALNNGDRSGPIYQEALRRVQIEQLVRQPFGSAIVAGKRVIEGDAKIGDLAGAILFGWLPSNLLPEGELQLRGLYTEYRAARDAWHSGDKSAFNDFFEEHPEYEARMALYGEPEEQVRQFLISEVWDTYHELEKLDQKNALEQLGPQFSEQFMNSEYDNLDIDTLAAWASALGGRAPGMDVQPAQFTRAPEELASAYQAYLDERNRLWPGIGTALGMIRNMPKGQQSVLYEQFSDYFNWNDQAVANLPAELLPYVVKDELAALPLDILKRYVDMQVVQNEYYDLNKGERKAYLSRHPELKAWWDFWDQYQASRPDLFPDYRPDEFDKTAPVDVTKKMTNELKQALYMSAYGKELPVGAMKELRYLWGKYGGGEIPFNDWVKQLLAPYQF